MYRTVHHTMDLTELDQYYEVIRPYYQVCAEKSVLEIGPFTGQITDLYCNIASSIELVEPNAIALSALQQAFPAATIVWSDIFSYLKKPKEFDVVVCQGVLYHLHSPIQLLEQLINEVKPKYMLLDTASNDHTLYTHDNQPYFSLGLNTEEANMPGNYYTKPGIPGQRTPGVNLAGFGPSCLTQVMTAMGYKAMCEPITSPNSFKNNLVFLAFERID